MQYFDIMTVQLYTDVREQRLFGAKSYFITASSDFVVFRTNPLYPLPLSNCAQFVGYSDEVLDVKFLGKDDSHIVVATNSCQLKVFELLTNSCQILYGHTGW